jgi:hypothetical protein
MNEKEQNPEIVVNQYGQTKDPAVIVEDANRTVLLTPDETLIIEKDPAIDIVPKNRPRTVYAGMWGRNEIVTAGLGVFALLVVVLIYFFLVLPSNRELARHKSEVQNLTENRDAAKALWGSATNTQDTVVKLVSSEENFESNYLPPAATGQNALYQRLNGLIDAYGLTNTSGPDYAPLETADQGDNNKSEEERGREKFRSIFPGVYVTMTVEGSYQNLRRFIKEIETGREFIVISAVQLEPSDSEKTTEQQKQPNQQAQNQTTGIASSNMYARPNQAGPAPVRPAAPVYGPQAPSQKGKTHGETVSLHMEMAAYFRRPNFVPTVSQ